MHLTSRITAAFMAGGLCVVVLAACAGGTSASQGFTPSSGAAGFAQLTPEKAAKIRSTCGTRIHMQIGLFVDCKFKEKGYGGNFNISNHTKGLVGISPNRGTKDTTFVVTGIIAGKGYFLVRDRHKNTLKVRVRVTL